ncbi:MAG: hypothetical protein NTW87_04450 [Planctomycetota bacterium]|nr:hypothetical protein [Planctomycetota bacterium]
MITTIAGVMFRIMVVVFILIMPSAFVVWIAKSAFRPSLRLQIAFKVAA